MLRTEDSFLQSKNKRIKRRRDKSEAVHEAAHEANEVRQPGSRRKRGGITPIGRENRASQDLAMIEKRERQRLMKRSRRMQRSGLPMTPGRVLFMSFFVPFMLMAIAFGAQGMWPVRDTTPLTIDLYHQYAPFLAELRTKMLNLESPFYSWNGGLGMNFYALMAYYLASPLNLLMLLFPPRFLSEAVTVLTLIKIGLIGLTSSYMLREAFSPYGSRTVAAKEPKQVTYGSETGTDWAQILMSTAFALSGFMLAYSWDIMWLDSIVMLPLIVTGLYRLIKDGRFVLYVVSLALAIVFNYYIAIFVCLFTGLYFFVLFVTVSPDVDRFRLNKPAFFLARLSRFTFASILGGLLSAFLSVPTYLALQITSATDDAFPTTWRLGFDFFEFIARHLIDMEPKIRSGLPNIYVGLAVFILVPVYLMTKHIRLSEKLAHLAILAFLYVSFNSNMLNFIWHGMHYPNQLPHRFAFVYSFVLIIMMYRAFSGLRDMSAVQLVIGPIVGILYIVMAERLIPEEVDHETAMVSVLFLILLTAAISLVRNKERSFRFMMQALTVVMILEIMVNSIVTITTIHINESYTRRSTFNGDFDEVRAELAIIEELEGKNSFYRTELIQQKTTNSPALYGYKGFTIFSSTSYEDTAKLMRRLGYHGNNINSYKYTSSTPLLNSIFGIEYLINKDAAIRDPLLEDLGTDSSLYSYRNPYALSPGFMVSSDILNWNVTSGTPFQIQNDFVAKASGHDSLFEGMEIETESAINMNDDNGTAKNGFAYLPVKNEESSEITLVIRNEESRHLFFHVDTVFSMSVNAVVDSGSTDPDVNSTVFEETRSINKPELFDMGFVEAGETVRIRVNIDEDKGGRFKIAAASLNQDAYINAMTELETGNLVITNHNSRMLSGQVEASDDGILFLSIPYDEYWQADVDGEAVSLVRVADGLSGVPLTAGTHNVTLTYTPPAFWIGVLISLLALVVLLLWLLIWRSRAGKRFTRDKQIVLALEQRQLLEMRARAGDVPESMPTRKRRSEPSGIRTTPLPEKPESLEESVVQAQSAKEAAAEMIAYHEREQELAREESQAAETEETEAFTTKET